MSDVLHIKHLFILDILIFLLSSCGVDSAQSSAATANDDGQEYSDGDGMPLDYFKQCIRGDCEFEPADEGRIFFGVPTWHPRAEGVALRGDRVSISVVDDFASHPDRDVACYLIRLLGTWDDTVSLSVTVAGEYGLFGISNGEDPDDEMLQNLPTGHFEMTKAVVASPWHTWELPVRAIRERGQMTFYIEKNGSADARFYIIQISGETYCPEGAVEVD